MDVAHRIRAQLAEGIPPGEIVARLVAEGMSDANARRIVDRIASEKVTPGVRFDRWFENGVWHMLAGAFACSLGTSGTALTYGLAKPGGKYMLAYGAIIGGIVLFFRGLKEFQPSRGPFPAKRLAAALLVPAVAAFGAYEWKRPLTLGEIRARADAADARDEQARKDAAEGEKTKAAAELKGKIDQNERLTRLIGPALEKMGSADPKVRCEGTRYYLEKGTFGHESPELDRLIESDPDVEVRRCAFDGIFASGYGGSTLISKLRKLEPYAEYKPLLVYGYTKLLDDPSEDVRTKAAAGLERVK